MQLSELEYLCINCMQGITNHGVCPICGFAESNYTPALNHLPPRSILAGKYMLGKVLGEGGFGITYLGIDLNLDFRVAIKEYYPTGLVTRESHTTTCLTPFQGEKLQFYQKGKDGFITEARNLAKYRTMSGIVSVNDFFQENGTAYIVMEYIEGVTFKNYCASIGGKMPSDQVFSLMNSVIRSMSAVHQSGVIHRDISPDNIMMSTSGELKILDFGAARSFLESGNKSLSVMLKPGYAPEEQYRSKGQQGPWTDVYSMCATIYKVITGITPDEACERLIEDTLQPPSALGFPIAPQKEAVLMRGLAVKQTDRLQSMDDLLAGFYGETSSSTQSHPTTLSPATQTPPPQVSAPANASPVNNSASNGNAPKKNNKIPIIAVSSIVGVIILALAISSLNANPSTPEAAAEEVASESPSESDAIEEIDAEPEKMDAESEAMDAETAEMDTEPEVNPIVEAAMVEIIENVGHINSYISDGAYYEVPLEDGMVAYRDDHGVFIVSLPSGYSNVPYERNYYYWGEELIFSVFVGSDRHEFYLSNDELMRWYYYENADVPVASQIFDLAQTDEYASWQEALLYENTYIRDAISRSEAEFNMTNVTSVSASSALSEYDMTHSADRVLDGNASTAWVEGSSGNGVGESISFSFNGDYYIHSMAIEAGYHKSSDLYYKNSRPSQIRVTFSDGSSEVFPLNDEMNRQLVFFSSGTLTSSITVTIESVYSGNKYQDVAISGIQFY